MRTFEERPMSKRARVAWVIVGWLIALGPLNAGLALLMGWWVLPFLALSLWGTWDFLRRGSLGDENLPPVG
jgi:hypothetical protein